MTEAELIEVLIYSCIGIILLLIGGYDSQHENTTKKEE